MKYILFLSSLLWVATSCKKQSEAPPVVGKQWATLVPVDSLNAKIMRSLKLTGEYNWKQATDLELWSAINYGNYLVSVGYCPKGNEAIEGKIHLLQLQDPEWAQAKKTVLSLIRELERKGVGSDLTDSIEIWHENILPVLNVEIKNYNTLVALRHSPYVRYVEPMEYDTQFGESIHQRGMGCDPNLPDLTLVAGVHYGTITPFAKSSWNYPDHGIADAWKSVTGKGIKIFLIDTGISFSQENLGNAFNQGFSGGRVLEKMVTLPRKKILGIINWGPAETPEDQCGHGTAMAGILAAPRGTDGNVAGIAYNASLVSCRASEDVFIDAAREVKGVSDAFTEAGSRSDVKVISMSMGRITVSSQIKDAIQYAGGRGKLIFCAAGTSLPFTADWAGVIFPASMPEVQAVTGVKQFTQFIACEKCHSGPEVDFVVVMERVSDSKHVLTVSDRGDAPSIIGGSSAATASMAAMTAIVWGKHPTYSRDQMLTLLQRYSNFYPQRHAKWGWGKFQPALAVN